MITVNGEPRELPSGATVAGLLDALGVRGGRGMAVAVDAEVVPRGAVADARECRRRARRDRHGGAGRLSDGRRRSTDRGPRASSPG